MPEISKASRKLATVGAIMIVLGVISLAAPLVTGIAITLVVGAIVLLAGLAMTAEAWKAHAFGGTVGDVLWGLLYVVAGAVLVFQPLLGLSFLTLLLALFFFFAGAWKSMVAWSLRPRVGWGLVMASGVVSLLLGVMILGSWPLSGSWAIGTLVGIELIFDGFTMVRLGANLREIAKAVGTAG
jgi:uncharacterized membrane protein HdeD (DUF308 family)